MNSAEPEPKRKKKEKYSKQTYFEELNNLNVSERLEVIKNREKKKLEARSRQCAANKVVGTEKLTALADQIRQKIELHILMALRQTGREDLLSEDETRLCISLIERLRETGIFQSNLAEDEDSNLPPNALAQTVINDSSLGASPPPLRSPSRSFNVPRKIDDLRDLILRLGGEFEDEFEGLTCKIEKSDCLWEVNIQNGSVNIASKTIETRKASVCIQWAGWTRFQGYNNLGFAPFDLLVLSKVVSILFDQLPKPVEFQVKQFIETGRGAHHVSPLFYTSPPEGAGPPPGGGGGPILLHTALRQEIADTFRRIRDNISQEHEPISTPQIREIPSQNAVQTHNDLHNEIVQAFGRSEPIFTEHVNPTLLGNSRSYQEARHAVNQLLGGRQTSNQRKAPRSPTFSINIPPSPPHSEDEAERQILKMLLAQLEARI